jgi:hypothetical protein
MLRDGKGICDDIFLFAMDDVYDLRIGWLFLFSSIYLIHRLFYAI